RRSVRFRSRAGASNSGEPLQGLPYDEAERLGAWLVDLPFDRRDPWRAVVGGRQGAAWHRLPIHLAVPSRPCLARVTLSRGRSSKNREGTQLARPAHSSHGRFLAPSAYRADWKGPQRVERGPPRSHS